VRGVDCLVLGVETQMPGRLSNQEPLANQNIAIGSYNGLLLTAVSSDESAPLFQSAVSIPGPAFILSGWADLCLGGNCASPKSPDPRDIHRYIYRFETQIS
jgi:hypothetical protein